MGQPVYKVVWPRGKRAMGVVQPAKRVNTLEGKTVGALWDWGFRGNEVFPIIAGVLARRYPGMKYISYEVFGSTLGRDERKTIAGLPEKLKQYKCDAVISGMGC